MTAQRISTGSATTTPHIRAVKSSAVDDPATHSWRRNPAQVSRDVLLVAAQMKLGRLLSLKPGWDGHRAKAPTTLAAMAANGLLTRLLFDDCPTPQLAPTPGGGVEVQWLVKGMLVDLDIAADGTTEVSVEDATGEVQIDGCFPHWNLDHVLLDQARLYLEKMSHDVLHRVSTS